MTTTNQPTTGAVVLDFERRLPAPPDAVYRAWTDARQFERWFAPHTMSVAHCTIDARVGGVMHFQHLFASGEFVWVRAIFSEVVPPSRLVFAFTFADESGNAVEREGFASSSTVIATFEPDGAGTLMRVRHQGLTVDQGESEGWKQTFERLEALFAEA